MPPSVFSEKNDRSYGASTFHKREYTDIKDIINNKLFKETLAEKVQDQVLADMAGAHMRKAKAEALHTANRSALLRRDAALNKLNNLNSEHWTQNTLSPSAHQVVSAIQGEPITEQKLSSFNKRSRSVLPPLSGRMAEESGKNLMIDMLRVNNRSPSIAASDKRASQSFSTRSSHQSAGGAAARDQLIRQLITEDNQEKMLDKVHQMRLKAYQTRLNENVTKPHMPLVNEDLKKAMVKDYFDAKRSLTKNVV